MADITLEAGLVLPLSLANTPSKLCSKPSTTVLTDFSLLVDNPHPESVKPAIHSPCLPHLPLPRPLRHQVLLVRLCKHLSSQHHLFILTAITSVQASLALGQTIATASLESPAPTLLLTLCKLEKGALLGVASISAPCWDPGPGERPRWVSSWVSTPISAGFLHHRARWF